MRDEDLADRNWQRSLRVHEKMYELVRERRFHDAAALLEREIEESRRAVKMIMTWRIEVR